MTVVVNIQKVSGVSGSEAHLLSVLPLLRERGFDARMLVLHEGEPGARRFVDELRSRDVPTDTCRMRFDLDPLVPARVLRLRADIVHTHLVHADLLCLPAAAARRIPIRVSTKHGFNEFRESRLLALADRTAARFATAQVAISQGLADYLVATEGFAPGAFEVVHYGIAAGPAPAPAPAEPRLLAVGRMIPIKGFDVLLAAFADARREVPGLTLDLAGAGPLLDQLRSDAPAGVRFHGRVEGMRELYDSSSIVVVPSRGEGFGMVALEAAERGRAAIVARVGGLPEIVEDGVTGLVVPSGDRAALAAAIVELARDPARAAELGAAARERALAQFSDAAAADGVARLYERLLSSRSSAAAASSASTKSNDTR